MPKPKTSPVPFPPLPLAASLLESRLLISKDSLRHGSPTASRLIVPASIGPSSMVDRRVVLVIGLVSAVLSSDSRPLLRGRTPADQLIGLVDAVRTSGAIAAASPPWRASIMGIWLDYLGAFAPSTATILPSRRAPRGVHAVLLLSYVSVQVAWMSPTPHCCREPRSGGLSLHQRRIYVSTSVSWPTVP